MSSQLPLCLQYAQALGVPLLALIIGAVGAWVAWQQMKVARVKLQHELFERRFRIFAAARKLLSEILQQGTASPDQLLSYSIDTADAVFLLNDDIAKYLEDMRKRASNLSRTGAALERLPEGERRSELTQKEEDNFAWLTDQIGGLVEKFTPILKLEK